MFSTRWGRVQTTRLVQPRLLRAPQGRIRARTRCSPSAPRLWKVSRLLPLKIRAAVNVLNLSTPSGIVIARLGNAKLRRGPRGLVFAEGYRFRFPIAGAFTVGNVIITARTMRALADRTPGVLKHEDAHAWQWCALGPLFLPSYVLAMGWSVVRTGSIALANPFEMHAGLVSGGYVRPDESDESLRARSARSNAERNDFQNDVDEAASSF